ncbi:LCP family protein [Cohnella sp.]|uniref:LCP family protein n=1 Tax=Cohnella sp. TaxID=1883426 RepID=UPI0035674A4C
MHKKWKAVLLAVLVLSFIFLCFVGWKVYGTYNQLDNIQKTKEESRFGQFDKNKGDEPPEWEGSERVNILLMGGDERGLVTDEVARSDSMIVVSFDPITKTIHLFSVLRDTHVDIPGYKSNRINTALSLGGPELAMKTIGNLTGLEIQYYVYVDFQGFIKLVDAVGGIDYFVEKDMRWSDSADDHMYDIDLKKGQQHLDGDKALQYVRFRHDKLSDFTRTERQRDFLKAIAAKLKSGWNLIRLPEILGEVTPYMESNMSVGDMRKLATLAYRSHQAGSAQIPPMELVTDEKVDGSSVLGIRSLDALKDYIQEKLSEDSSLTTPEPSP